MELPSSLFRRDRGAMRSAAALSILPGFGSGQYDRIMDFCPNCGEPIDSGASACPHCGSDDETGWNPDAEYYGLELPEDEDDAAEASPRERLSQSWVERRGGIIVLTGAAACLWAAFHAYGWAGLLPVGFLGACAAVYLAGTRRRAA